MIGSLEARELVRRPMLVPSPLQQYMPGSVRMESHDCLLLAALGGDSVEENYALVFGTIDPERVFSLARSFFGSDEYSIVIESGTARALDELLQAQEWPIDEDVPALLLKPIPARPEASTSLEIRPVTTELEYEDFMNISQTGRRWVPSLKAATDPNVGLFVGYIEKRPVATSRLNCLGTVGDINGIVTDPDYRRRGFGTEMTWAAIAEGVKRGCTAIVLTATEMGYPVYLRMGFEPVCNYRTYLRPNR